MNPLNEIKDKFDIEDIIYSDHDSIMLKDNEETRKKFTEYLEIYQAKEVKIKLPVLSFGKKTYITQSTNYSDRNSFMLKDDKETQVLVDQYIEMEQGIMNEIETKPFSSIFNKDSK